MFIQYRAKSLLSIQPRTRFAAHPLFIPRRAVKEGQLRVVVSPWVVLQHMSDSDQTISLLARIEENQRTSLESQEKQLALAQAQLERSNRTIAESIELQRSSVARQTQAIRIILPLVGVLLVLLGYLLFKYRIF